MSRPKVGDIVSFKSWGGKSLGDIVTGRVTWIGGCGIDVKVGNDDVVTIDEEDIVPTPKPTEGS